jgi:hypothetical protein
VQNLSLPPPSPAIGSNSSKLLLSPPLPSSKRHPHLTGPVLQQQYNITLQVKAPATFYGSFLLGTEIRWEILSACWFCLIFSAVLAGRAAG